MKKVVIALFALSLITVAAKAQDQKAPVPSPTPAAAPAPDPNAGVFKFKDKDNTHDYGEVPQGPTAEYDFEFTNTGKKPITISEAHGSCGCTVPNGLMSLSHQKERALYMLRTILTTVRVPSLRK